MRFIHSVLCAQILCALALSAGPAAAEPNVAQPMRLIISAGSAGSFDVAGRLVARHLGRHLPGHPQIVPSNMPGASGRIAANHLYNAAPRDGSVIGLIQGSTAMAQVLGEDVRYDAARFNWIGSPVRLGTTLVVWHAAGIRTIDDAKTRVVAVGATSMVGSHYINPKLANALLGTRFKIVTGYPDAPHIDLAMARGEVEARFAEPWSTWKLNHPDWVREGKIVPVVQLGMARQPGLAHVPLMTDLATDATARAILDLVSINGEISRPIAAPPGLPGERVAALREAFRKTVADPEFLADAAKAGIDVDPVFGDALDALTQRVLATPRSTVDLFKAVLAAKD